MQGETRTGRGEEQSDIGQRIRLLREQRGLSQRELALSSDLSPNTLSLIERGQTSPTASTLQKLAAALKVSLGAIFATDSTADQIIYTRSSKRRPMEFSHGYAENLGPDDEHALVTPLVINLEPGARSGEPMTHNGKEFVYCLRGQMLYAIDDHIYLLEAGDSLLFDADISHRWQNAGGEQAEALMVLCFSEAGRRAILHDMGDSLPDQT